MNSSWFRKLLLSYLPVFVVVVTILFVVFFQSLSEQNRKQAIKANEFLAEQAVRFTDNSLKTLDYQILRDTLSSADLKRFFGTDSDDVYGNIQGNKLIDDWKLNYSIIDSAYFIRVKDRFVLGDGSGLQSDFLDQPFILPFMNRQAQPGKWSGKRSFKPYQASKPADVITLVQGYPQLTKAKKGYVVVNVSLSKLKNAITPMYNPAFTFIRISDQAGGILMDDNGVDNGKRSVLASYISPYTGWLVESGPASGSLSRIALDFYNVWVVIALAVVVLGVLWVVHVTRRNYKPISQLVSLIRTSALVNPGIHPFGSNEFGFIQGALEQLMEETTRTRQKDNETIILQKKHRFQEAVLGTAPVRETEWQTDLLAFHVNPAGARAFMLELEIDRYAQFTAAYHHQDQSILKFVVASVAQEIAGLSGASVWAEWVADRRLSVIVWVPDEADGASLGMQIGEQVLEWVRGNLSFTVTIGIHGMAENLEEIRRSHEIARDMLHYKAVLGTGRLLDATAMEGAKYHGHDFFGTIHALSQSIRLAEDGWRKHLDELFGQITDAVSSRKEIESFMQFLQQQLNRVFLELSKDYRNVWKDADAALRELWANWETLAELKQSCAQIFEAAAGKLQTLKDSQGTRAVIGDIRAYIEENYPNPELSLDHLSAKFSLHAKNISKLFKEEFGGNFVDFLIGLRMDKAKQQLLSTDKSLQEISAEVGYFNYNSFNRAFKNVAGMSPSDYRKRQADR
ncbi:helix-turn-helix domain-containing protein [Paenibacillus sacheonensis]|uniref:Helix-turn-helix domain-containing protein n=1 Tax=Paenibacillus sacheonensis TaxID=742054 RepID=A0A7X4YNF4_9BACL|nr:helix-turn-helix domain-containing protein [Paenibacillus sacheonensis]MBM7566039.1 AraC-like DNA-binding protein [Paenibacillus sacheonensis]NBC68649.1 helix-turn-helix domain-containing protein [Paenibacillus sacheonensis]